MFELERRDLLKYGGAAAALMVCAPMISNAAPLSRKALEIEHKATQILVLGGGVAGVMAALAASQSGARVMLVEKSAVGLGGMSGWARYWLDVRGRESTVRDTLISQGEGLGDTSWIDISLQHGAAVAELWEKWGWPDVPPLQRRALWLAQLHKAGVTVVERTMAVQFLQDAQGRIAGIVALPFSTTQGAARLQVIRATHVIHCMGSGALRGPQAMLWGLSHDGSAMAYQMGAAVRGKEFTDLSTPYPRYAFLEDSAVPPPAKMLAGAQLSVPILDPETRLQIMRADVPKPEDAMPVQMVGTGVLTGEGVVAAFEDGAVVGVAGLHAAGAALASMVSGARYAMPGLGWTASGAQGWMVGKAVARLAQSMPPAIPDPDHLENVIENIWAPRVRPQGYSPLWVRQNLQQSVAPFFVSYSKHEKRLKAAEILVRHMVEALQPMLIAASAHELRAALEVRNLLLDQQMRLQASLARTESRGTHIREDYPLKSSENYWLDIVRGENTMHILRTAAA